jgi:predicted nucleic acid-binding protein
MARYTDALLNKPKILSYLVDATIAHRAAELRARSSLRTPDAIQIATAVSVGAQAFITNAARLKNVPDIPVFIISEFV